MRLTLMVIGICLKLVVAVKHESRLLHVLEEAINDAQKQQLRSEGDDCEYLVLTAENGTIKTPGFDNGVYLSNLMCSYSIEAPEGKKIKISFSSFSVEYYAGCLFDYVYVYDGPYFENEVYKACGDTIPQNVTSTGPILSIQFSSDESVEWRGFVLNYSFEDDLSYASDDPCDGTPKMVNGDNIEIATNNPYGDNNDCYWNIQGEIGSTLRLSFSELEIESEKKECSYDFLAVYEGRPDSVSETPQVKLCGDSIPDDIIVNMDQAMLYFHSDDSVNYRGFALTVISESA